MREKKKTLKIMFTFIYIEIDHICVWASERKTEEFRNKQETRTHRRLGHFARRPVGHIQIVREYELTRLHENDRQKTIGTYRD